MCPYLSGWTDIGYNFVVLITLLCPHLAGWTDIGYNFVVLITLLCPHLAGWTDIGYNFVVLITLLCPHLAGWMDIGYNFVVLITLLCPHLAGWTDIGYNFVVGEDGNAYMARGWTEIGAHTHGYNSVGIGELVGSHKPSDGPWPQAIKREIQSGVIVQELCESRGGRPAGLSVLTSLLVSVDVTDLLNRALALVTTCP